jgi:hypothetical protein
MALGSTQPPTEMSTGNLPGGKGRPARKADNLTAICELTVPQPYGPSRPLTGIALPYFTFIIMSVQPFIEPCPLLQFLDPIHSR